MKHILLVILLLVTACIPFGIFEKKRPSEDEGDIPMDGVRRDATDVNVPKHIESDEIVEFSCEFSAFSIVPGENTYDLCGNLFTLEAIPDEDGCVKCLYNVRPGNSFEECQSKAFVADSSFLKALQEVVSSTDLARHNGIFVSVSGLPDMYGAKISIKYSSGEAVFAYDNESCFMSCDEMYSLKELFRKQAENEE